MSIYFLLFLILSQVNAFDYKHPPKHIRDAQDRLMDLNIEIQLLENSRGDESEPEEIANDERMESMDTERKELEN